MSLLDKIKGFIFGSREKQIGAGETKKENEEDIEIQIDLIKKIIKNEDGMYDKLKGAEEGDCLFNTTFTKSQYKDAIFCYIEFANKYGIQFDRKELRRIRKLMGIKVVNSNLKNSVIKENHDNYEMIVKICNSDQMTEELLNLTTQEEYTEFGQKYNFNLSSCKKVDIARIISKFKQIKPYNNVSIKLNNINTSNYNKLFFNYVCNSIDSYEIELNEELKSEIIKNIPENIDNLSKAIAIYVELNKILEFNYKYTALCKSVYDSNILELFFQDVNTVNLDNNSIICYSWSKIYAKLCKEIIPGVKAYVWAPEDMHPNDTRSKKVNGVKVGNFSHRFVYIVDESSESGFILRADATNGFFNRNDKTLTNDLDRAKLGWEPVGIKLDQSKQSRNLSDVYTKLGYKFNVLSLVEESELAKDLDELNELFGQNENGIEKKMFEREKCDNSEFNYKKLDLILKLVSDVGKKNNYAPYLVNTYLRNVLYITFGKNNYAELIDCFKEDNGKYMSYPLLRLNFGNDKKPNYKYIIYEKEKGFYETTLRKLKDEKFIVEGFNMIATIQNEYVNGNLKEVEKYFKDEFGSNIILKTKLER